jgi:excisionase family DNA binding protein
MLRPQEVAQFFDVTVRTVYNWVDEGVLKSVSIGGVVRIPRESILQIISTSDGGIDIKIL